MKKQNTSQDKNEFETPEKFTRVCNNNDCDWFTTNPNEPVVYCGCVGPLCPECNETTTDL